MLAGFAGRHTGVVLGLYPALPVRPPGSGGFARPGQPAVVIVGCGAVRPVLIFPSVGRIDDAGNMAGAGDDEIDLAAKGPAAEKDGFGRRDMIVAGCQIGDLATNWNSIRTAICKANARAGVACPLPRG